MVKRKFILIFYTSPFSIFWCHTFSSLQSFFPVFFSVMRFPNGKGKNQINGKDFDLLCKGYECRIRLSCRNENPQKKKTKSSC